jgi:hypothetical protein
VSPGQHPPPEVGRSPASAAWSATPRRESIQRTSCPRSLGGCDDALCVVAPCRARHRRYDSGTLDLVAHLEPRHRAEAAHAVEHLGLAGALRRISGNRA